MTTIWSKLKTMLHGLATRRPAPAAAGAASGRPGAGAGSSADDPEADGHSFERESFPDQNDQGLAVWRDRNSRIIKFIINYRTDYCEMMLTWSLQKGVANYELGPLRDDRGVGGHPMARVQALRPAPVDLGAVKKALQMSSSDELVKRRILLIINDGRA